MGGVLVGSPGEKHQGLSIQSRQLRDGPQALASCEVEGNNFVAPYAVEKSVGRKAQAARIAERRFPIGRENPD